MAEMAQWLVEVVGALGYTGIFLLMAIESSFIPLPSEIVMIPAGYLAYQGQMHLGVVIFCGTVGSLAGAYANYYLAWYVGRPFLRKFGRYFFLSPDKLAYVDRFFARHGSFSTFTGRLLPMVRHLISIPAGLARMPHGKFSLYTLLGAGIWTTVLTLLGYFIGDNEALLKEYLHLITLTLLVLLAVAALCYKRIYRYFL